MGSQPPAGGDKPQGEINNNNNTSTSNNNSIRDYKDIPAGAGNDTNTPGKKKASFDADFIIISEFSEQVGPIPIDIIPEWASAGTFDLNSFVLKIMAVDFQNKSNDPQCYLKDSQVAMPEPNDDAYTYLHHFNLLDVFARGAFESRRYVRPMCISYITHDRNKIMDYFHEIMTKVMKRGNHRLFLRDLEDRMADVRYTQAVMSSGQDMDAISPTPITVNEYLTDLEVMHQKFHRAVTLKQQRRAAREANAKGSPHSRRSTPQPDEDEDDFGEEEDSEGEGKHDGGAKEDGRNRREGMPIEKSLNKAVAELSREYQPQVIHSLHPRTLHGKSLRNLQGLCDGNLTKAMALLNSLHRHYSRPCTVLALDLFDTPSLMPASSLLTIGQSVMLNFNLEMDKYMSKVINYEAERALSSGNIAALVNNANLTQTVTSNSSSIDDDTSSYDSARSMGSAASSPARDELYIDEAMLVNGLSAAVPPEPHVMRLQALDNEEGPSSPSSPGEEKSTPKAKPIPNINFFSANLWPPLGPQMDFPGKGLLELRGKFIWLRHVVYSILRGRPVVIWGSAQNESTVRGIVQALSILVAGITPWRTKSLKMSDLATFKLTGLVRTCQIAKAVEKYVTILDLENESLKSPPYPIQGKFIDEILALKKQWPDELSYLAHVHYVLFDVGVKACLYYHICCVAVHQLTPQQASQAHAYAHQSAHPPHCSTPGHVHPHSHHSASHHHTSPHHPSSHGPQQPAQMPRSHSPHAQAHLRQHAPPSPRQAPQPHSSHRSPSQPPSQTPSPHPSQPPSPRPAQPPSPYPSQPPSPRQPLLPSPHSPSLRPHNPSQPPPHSFVPLQPTVTTAEPDMEIRPEPVRLDVSQVILPPTDMKIEPEMDLRFQSPESKRESPELRIESPDSRVESPDSRVESPDSRVESPEAKTDPRAEGRPRADSKTDGTRRRKGTVGTLQAMRSQSMTNIGERYRSSVNSNANNSTTNPQNASNVNFPTLVNAAYVNAAYVNINSSSGIPNVYGNVKPGEEWRNSSSPSPSSSRHSSWQYTKTYGSHSYRSLSDSQISPAIWLPTSPATREKTRAQFLHQFEVAPGDSDIVVYLAEVVKEQQACEVQGTETPVIRLDYSSCDVFYSKLAKEGPHSRRPSVLHPR